LIIAHLLPTRLVILRFPDSGWWSFPRSAKKLLRGSGVLGHATGAGTVLESPGSRSPTEAEDLGLAAMMGDGEAPIVGGGQTEVSATTSSLEVVPAATEWAPARERTVENSTLPPSTRDLELPATISVPMASEQIPAAVRLRLEFLQIIKA